MLFKEYITWRDLHNAKRVPKLQGGYDNSKLLQGPPVRSHGAEVLLGQSKALATLVALKRLQTSTLLGRERELVVLAHDAVKHQVVVKQHIVENELAWRATAA